jgi:hypothetical protein
MTLGPQFQRNVWDTGKVGPYPGTAKNPQGRLFRPEYTGDPDALAPDRWLDNDGNGTAPSGSIIPQDNKWSGEYNKRQVPKGKDILTWHTNTGALHDYEDESRFDERSFSTSVHEDEKGRPLSEDMGYALGTHFGTIQAGLERYPGGGDKEGHLAHAHPVKIARNTVLGNEAGPKVYNDYQANHSSNLTDNMEAGGTIAYTNDVEDSGTVSYRTLRQTARSWNDDMDTAISKSSRFGIRGPRPMYREAHEQGYSPVVESAKLRKRAQSAWSSRQALPGMEKWANAGEEGKFPSAVNTAGLDGKQFTMKKLPKG